MGYNKIAKIKLICIKIMAPSSNGRMPDLQSGNTGPNPVGATIGNYDM
jgi:hypothetical protein